MNTLTISHPSLAVIRQIEQLAKSHNASIHLSLTPTAPPDQVVAHAPTTTGTTGGVILSIQHTSPHPTLHVSAPCACSGTYTIPINGIVRQAVGDEGSGLWNTSTKQIEPQPFKAGEFARLNVTTTGEEALALISHVHLGRDNSGKQAWMLKIEKVK